MSLPSKDICDLLESESSLGLVLGQNLFIGFEPDSPANCTTIYDTPGFKPETELEKGRDIYKPSIQVKVRNNSYVTAGALINQIKDELHNITNQTVNGSRYIHIQCSQEPFSLGRDVNGKSQWVCNFDLMRT